MQKHPTASQSKPFRTSITLLTCTLLTAGMAACKSPGAPGNAQTGGSQMNSVASTGSNDRTALSPDQKAAMEQRREAVKKQIEAVLTPEQKQQFETKLQQGEKMRKALSELNLTPEQQTKIREIRKAAYAQYQKSAPPTSPQ